MDGTGSAGASRQDATSADIERLVTAVAATAYWQGENATFDHGALVSAADGNRWNVEGDPTLYLAGDPGVALIEAGRHETGTSSSRPLEGIVWSVEVDVAGILDVRHEDVRRALGLDEPHWFLDRPRCRELAGRLRASGACAGLITQSAGLPDEASRWNLVLFADRLPRALDTVVTRPRRFGSFRLGPATVPPPTVAPASFEPTDR